MVNVLALRKRAHRSGEVAAPARTGTVQRLDIQGMRALAVLLVVANHLFAHPRGGFVGVDIFFVISGFLITGLLRREGEVDGKPSLREFYAKRARRILPLAVLVLVVTDLVALKVFSSVRAGQTRVDSVWALFFGANINMSRLGTDYFQQNRPPAALQHFWSLSVEEQFYVVWPLLIIAVCVRVAPGRLRGRALLAVAVVGSLASFVYAVHLTDVNRAAAYFSTPARAWELGVGAVLALSLEHVRRVREDVRAGAAWVGLAMIAAAVVTYDEGTKFPGLAAALPVIGAVLVLGAADPKHGPGQVGLLSNRLAGYLGDISYSLYLWHFPCIILAAGYFPERNATFYLCAGVLPFVLAIGSHHLIEDPVRHSKVLSAKPSRYHRRTTTEWFDTNKQTLDGLMAVAVVVVLAAAAIVLKVPTLADGSGQPAAGSTSVTLAAASQAPQSPVQEALAASTWPPGLVPRLEDLESSSAPQWTTDNCLTVMAVNEQKCHYGKATGPLVVVVGDSIAASWMPGLIKALPAARLQMLTRGQCPEVDTPTLDDKNNPHPECTAHRAWVLQELARLRPALIISSSQNHNFLPRMEGRGTVPQNAAANYAPYGAAITRKLTTLKALAPAVVLLQSPPLTANLIECRTPRSAPRDCVRTELAPYVNVTRLEREAGASVGVPAVEVQGWFCAQLRCPSFLNDIITTFDGAHLTKQMSEGMAGKLREALCPATNKTAVCRAA